MKILAALLAIIGVVYCAPGKHADKPGKYAVVYFVLDVFFFLNRKCGVLSEYSYTVCRFRETSQL